MKMYVIRYVSDSDVAYADEVACGSRPRLLADVALFPDASANKEPSVFEITLERILKTYCS